MEKLLLDSEYVDVKFGEGKISIELPIVEVLRKLALRSDNKIDDALVELVAKALEA